MEVKHPYKHRDSTLEVMMADPTFCLEKHLSLKRGHAYYTQAPLEMYVYDGAVVCTGDEATVEGLNGDKTLLGGSVISA